MKNTWLLRLSIVINFLLIIPVNNAQNSSMSFLDDVMAVSYTHLTLPTICSV